VCSFTLTVLFNPQNAPCPCSHGPSNATDRQGAVARPGLLGDLAVDPQELEEEHAERPRRPRARGDPIMAPFLRSATDAHRQMTSSGRSGCPITALHIPPAGLCGGLGAVERRLGGLLGSSCSGSWPRAATNRRTRTQKPSLTSPEPRPRNARKRTRRRRRPPNRIQAEMERLRRVIDRSSSATRADADARLEVVGDGWASVPCASSLCLSRSIRSGCHPSAT